MPQALGVILEEEKPNEDGQHKNVTSSDVNAYLREITGRDATAKDFRTWAGSVLAALALQEFGKFDSQAQLTATFGHSGGPGHPWPPMATYGHLFIRKWPIATH